MRYQGHSEPYTIQEMVELARLGRENKQRPSYASQEVVRAWLAEHRLRWAKEGHPDYQHLIDTATVTDVR